jgi:hypothetical protein
MDGIPRVWSMNAALCGVLACGPRPGDDAGSAGSDEGSGETGVPTGGVETSGSTEACEPGSGGAEPECAPDAGACSLEHQVCVLGFTEFADDCGVVEMEDDVTQWQAAHDCALAAASERRTFKLIADQFGYDSLQTDAYVAGDACPYAITRVHFDDDPCGGEGCGPVVFVAKCAALTAEPGCVVEPGEVCLRCGVPGEDTQVCGP